MVYADQATAWHALYATLGGSAAALIGLLTLLVLSILLLIPGQERWALGGELLAGGLVLALVGKC